MKLLHLGDLHFGKSLGEFDLTADQEYILGQILSIIREKEVDGVLIAGDVYDRAQPSEAAVKLLDGFLKDLVEAGVKVYMISGNHDSDDRLNFGSALFEANHIYISAVFDGTLHKVTVEDAFGEVDVYLLPFVKASQVRRFFPEAKIENYEDAVRVVIESANIDKERRNVLAAHQFVTGKSGSAVLTGENTEDTEQDNLHGASQDDLLDPETGGSEGLGTLTVGLVEKIGYDVFEAFDYVALGHIHAPQQVGRPEVRYSGSPLKYSVSEVSNEKSVPVITLREKGEAPEIELVPLHPMRDMRHIKGPLSVLLDKDNVTRPHDFMYVTLTDEDIINDAINIVRQTYENTVKLDYDNSRTKALMHVDTANVTEKKSFDELISDFYRLVYGVEISEEELACMKQAAEEAGAIDETD